MSTNLTLAELVGADGLFCDGDWVESKDQDPAGDVRLIQLADVGDGHYVNKSARFLTSQKANTLRCTFLQPGDILIARMPDPLGRACIFPGDAKKCVTVVDVAIVRPGQGIERRWLLHGINSPSFREQIVRHVKGATRQRISRTNLASIELGVPSLAEQRRIADILDKADAIRRKRKEAIAVTEELLRSAFLEMFGDPVTNPKGWPVVSLGDIAREMMYGTSEKCDSIETPTSIPVLRIPNIAGGIVLWNDLKYATLSETESKKLLLKSGDLLFVRSNGNPAYIGRCAVYDDTRRALYASYLIRVRLSDSDLSLPSYIQAALSTASYRSTLTAAAQTTAGNYNISTQGLRRLLIPLPPIQHQRSYATLQARIERLGRLSVTALRESDSLFASLLHRAFRGELTARGSRSASPASKQLSLLE